MIAKTLAKAFWPGACTLVLDRTEDCPLSLLVSAGLDTIALRVPAHETAHELLEQSGLPIAAPSANRSGKVSPTQAEHVEEEFADYPEELTKIVQPVIENDYDLVIGARRKKLREKHK